MSRDEFQYQRIFQMLKNKIESGVIPKGSSLPSCAKLCKEYDVSAKTIRRVLVMLSDAGLIKTSEGKRAVVIDQISSACPPSQRKEPNPIAMADIIKTAQLLCRPMICRGVSLCRQTDWAIPEQIVRQMDPEKPAQFWQNSKLFWRFFIARCENELALRILGSLGFSDLVYCNDSMQIRTTYQETLLASVKKFQIHGCTREDIEHLLRDVYNATPISAEPSSCVVPPDSPLRIGIQSNEQWLKTAEERYSSVYLDLLGLISVGRYQPGDQLPSHGALQKQYGVSVVTTTQAIKTLKQWGVVETVRGKGIFVSETPPPVEHLPISTQLIASYVKRYLENVELLALTAEGVANYVAASVSSVQVQSLRRKLSDLGDITQQYQPASLAILEFLTEYIPCDAMRAVYATVLENHRIGIKIPGLASIRSAAEKQNMYQRCMDAVDTLAGGDAAGFAKQTAELFQYIHRQIIKECDQLNYLHAAQALYDTSLLWK